MFDHYLTLWRLTPDGEPIVTPTSQLLPVRHGRTPAMLKIAVAAEERRGAAVMSWWGGDGAAEVMAHEGDALLLARATGTMSLSAMARSGRDDDASRIMCVVAARLHAPKPHPAPELIQLPVWFAALGQAAARHGGVVQRAARAADALLAEPREVVVLHGDIHHENVLDAGPRGFVAIDPKGLVGERTFDFANIFCNPDLETATSPGRLARQADVIAEAAQLDRARLLLWVLAYAGLSAAWSFEDGDDPALALAVARLALEELERSA